MVRDLPPHFGWNRGRFKLALDVAACLFSLILSFAVFGLGQFVGIGWGTIVCAMVNGAMIEAVCKWMEKTWSFENTLPKLAALFEKA